MGLFFKKKRKVKKEKTRICVLGTRGFPGVQGGIEKHCEKLYPLIAGENFDVIVFARKYYVNKKPFKYKKVKIVPLPNVKSKHLEAFLHTFYGIFVAKRLKCDILHIHAVGPSLFVPLAKLLGMKVVMTHHGRDYKRKKWGKFAKFVLKIGEYLGCRFADDVICISDTIGLEIEKKFGRKINIIPNGVVDSEKTNVINNVSMVKFDDVNELSKWRIQKGKYILAVGRIVPEKGFDNLIKAFLKAKKKLMMQSKLLVIAGSSKVHLRESKNAIEGDYNDLKLVIVGAENHRSNYFGKLKALASGRDDIVFTGALNGRHLEVVFKNACLFVLPSFHEGLPIALLEAMSFGLSCLASNISGNLNIGLAKERYFDPNDIDNLSDKIVEFVRNPISETEKRNQILLMSKKYNWFDIAIKTQKVFSKVSN